MCTASSIYFDSIKKIIEIEIKALGSIRKLR